MDSRTGFRHWGPLGNLSLHGLLAMLAVPILVPTLYLSTTWSKVSLCLWTLLTTIHQEGFSTHFVTVLQGLRDLHSQNYFNRKKPRWVVTENVFIPARREINGIITPTPEGTKLFKKRISIWSYSLSSLCFHSPSNKNANYWPTFWYFFQGHLCGSLWKSLQFETNRTKWFCFFALSVT